MQTSRTKMHLDKHPCGSRITVATLAGKSRVFDCAMLPPRILKIERTKALISG